MATALASNTNLSKPYLLSTLILASVIALLSACSTTGHLKYIDTSGQENTACETEYFGLPRVDKFAVEYVLSYCAKKANSKGYRVADTQLLDKIFTIPRFPYKKGDNSAQSLTNQQTQWTFELADKLWGEGKLTDQEFGYLVAYIDMGHHLIAQEAQKVKHWVIEGSVLK